MSVNSNHNEVLGEFTRDQTRWAMAALNAAQVEAINYVRGNSEGMIQPGARIRTSKSGSQYYWYSPSLPVRRAHPGGWADVTGITANLYGMEEPKQEGRNILGSLYNTAEHAEDLEGKHRIGRGGERYYWVLGGITADPRFESEFDIGHEFERQFNRLVDDQGG